MDDFLFELGWMFAALFIGVALGSLTGLIPGFHVNNVALILLALSPAILSLGIPLSAVAGIIVSTGVVHTFLNYIPSALIGAPDGDTALSLLPGHRMLLSGNAPKGVAWSARGSQLGLFLSLPLIVAARIAFGPELGFYDALRGSLPFILLIISALLLATETTRLDFPRWIRAITGNRLGKDSRFAGFIAATAFFLLAGLYGWGVFNLPARSPVGMPDASLLLPSLAGLFGIANLLDIYATTSELPPQKEDWELPPAGPLVVPCFLSSCAGAAMGVLPGMTAAQATVLVMGGRNVAAKIQGKEGMGLDWETRQMSQMSDEELLAMARAEAAGEGENPYQKQDLEIIALLSATNTAVTVMVLGFLYIIGRSRSGATLALKQMYPIDTWNGLHPTADFIRLLALTIAAGLIAVPIMRHVGKGVLRLHEAIPLQSMVLGVIIFVVALVWLSTGMIGIGVLIIGTIMGLMPPRIGIRRSHGMGIILVPIMIYTFAQKFDAFGFL
ncbi:MAG: tripartite tricarboxylate transporter permease [Candidatus Poseidoniaceae archaeon]|jgi:putative membrane protein|nr:tripartite tricarboxylate transporter permease [Candidatus Poseidoniaceae archaeon]